MSSATAAQIVGADSQCKAMTHRPGTYALILYAKFPAQIRVGHWGALNVHPGYYLYVGSAFGPGGAKARVTRHCRDTKRLRWHIDFLRKVAMPVEVWCSYDCRDLEHRWANAFSCLPGISNVPGFGCSDCQCESHLFVSRSWPDLDQFTIAAGMRPQIWPLQPISEPINRSATITGSLR